MDEQIIVRPLCLIKIFIAIKYSIKDNFFSFFLFVYIICLEMIMNMLYNFSIYAVFAWLICGDVNNEVYKRVYYKTKKTFTFFL